MNTPDTQIPSEPLSVSSRSFDFSSIIATAVHSRNGCWYHESSYSHFVQFAIFFILAVAVCFIPWDARGIFGVRVKFFIAAGILWGGVCVLAPYFIRNRIGQRITINPSEEIILIQQRDTSNVVSEMMQNPLSLLTANPPSKPSLEIPFTDVIGIQLTGNRPYQANLVYKRDNELIRHNLINHDKKSFARSIAKSYVQAGGFELIDED